MNIFEKLKQIIMFNKSYKEYLKSVGKSAVAINNVSLSDGMTPLYFSERRYQIFCDTFKIKPVINSSVEDNSSSEGSFTVKGKGEISRIGGGIGGGIEYTKSSNNCIKTTKNYGEDSYIQTIKNSIKDIKNVGYSILDAVENNFFYANFPVFHGSLIGSPKVLTDVYLWYGEYRNIKLYLCGNTKNVFSVDNDESQKTEWNPSTIQGQMDIFQYFIDEEKPDTFEKDDIFKLFEENIFQSVMNRTDMKSSYQWQEMIVYCTNIKEENGIKKVIGIPLLVIPSKEFGYGWYNLKYKLLDNGKIKNGDDITKKDTFFELDDGNFKINNDINNKDAFFEFDNGKFTGRFLMKEKILNGIHSRDEVTFSDKIDIKDINRAYQHRYLIKKTQSKPSSKQVKDCNDIIGICIDENLLKQ